MAKAFDTYSVMVPRLSDILELLEKIAPSDLAEVWDNPGLQVGRYSQEIRKILFSLDPTIEAIRTAQKGSAQLLLTHHPLIFKPLSRLDTDSFPGNVVSEAIKNGISIVSAHTNLDMAKGGINDVLAGLLDLQNVEVLVRSEKDDEAGLGRIGDLLHPVTLAAMTESIKRILGTGDLKPIGPKDRVVRRVAVVGGSGGDLVHMACERGADILLTGDIGHHQALEARALGIALIDGGHFGTEKAAFRVIADHMRGVVTAEGWKVEIEVDEDEEDPMLI
ncbi:MAG: Nif3-like dinuclear metal center hexameric protein [Desulfatiglans sp.]|nr:Nif3-like dinuclear metal center hexameric protein [Desulfatiglans sp.]